MKRLAEIVVKFRALVIAAVAILRFLWFSVLYGEGENMFSQLGDLDDLFLKVRASF
ncbi:MAG: hypothetical protein J7K88_01965 [Candidatus Fermentibacteraceae bacterium]|nr:hypothetical protein [Candidatus Fermentibacteraceae bacterium]